MEAGLFYLIIGLIGGGVLTGGVGIPVIAKLTKAGREKRKQLARFLPTKANGMPAEISSELRDLRSDLERLVELEEFKTATALASVIEMTQELFKKLKNRGDGHQINLAAVSYGHMLHKVNKALSDEYFFDMIQRPDMWNRVEERKAMVRNVVKIVNGEILDAIRDFNSASDFHVEVDLEALLRRNDADELLKDLI